MIRSQIQRPECLLCSVQQNSQILAVNTEIAANVIFISFLEEDLAQQPSVSFGKLIQNLAYLLCCFLANECAQQVRMRRGNLGGFVAVLHQSVTATGAVVFQ